MDITEVNRRLAALKERIDPRNIRQEDIDEILAIWDAIGPTMVAVFEWWDRLPDIAKTIEVKSKVEANSQN